MKSLDGKNSVVAKANLEQTMKIKIQLMAILFGQRTGDTGVRAQAIEFVGDCQRVVPARLELLANYQTPEWFQDAKFGIWAH